MPEQITFGLRQVGNGTPVVEVCRKLGIAKHTRTWRCLLGGDVPSLMLHFQAPVQSLKYIFDCTGVAGPVRTGQQMESTPAISESVVPGDSASVFETQHFLQRESIHLSIGGFRLLGRHLEAAVEAWQENPSAHGLHHRR